MQKLLPWVGALALGAGLLFAPALSSHAAPVQSMLPGLENSEDASVTPIHCRRYRHCHSRCVRRAFGICRKRVRYCHRC
jgi:hypothetical protein